jgi:hypothetical protein
VCPNSVRVEWWFTYSAMSHIRHSHYVSMGLLNKWPGRISEHHSIVLNGCKITFLRDLYVVSSHWFMSFDISIVCSSLKCV